MNARTGVATISGTYTCTNGHLSSVTVKVRQNVDRFSILGFGSFSAFDRCEEVPHTWASDVRSESGKFHGGEAMTEISMFLCGPWECSDGFVEQTVRLRGGRK